jgi:hypothetical protein
VHPSALFFFDVYERVGPRTGEFKMTHEFSVELHAYIKKKILSDCKSFLTEQFNPRLPRRIRERFLGKKSAED